MGDEQPTAYTSSADKEGATDAEQTSVIHRETNREPSKWKVSKTGDGDAAMALFSDPNEVHEPIDPKDEKKLIRKIDFMILPYLSVCYAFFYIDKVCMNLSLFLLRTEILWAWFWHGYLIMTDDIELCSYIRYKGRPESTRNSI